MKVAIVFYSTWGHIKQMAEAEAKGIKAAGGEVDMFVRSNSAELLKQTC